MVAGSVYGGRDSIDSYLDILRQSYAGIERILRRVQEHQERIRNFSPENAIEDFLPKGNIEAKTEETIPYTEKGNTREYLVSNSEEYKRAIRESGAFIRARAISHGSAKVTIKMKENSQDSNMTTQSYTIELWVKDL
ncbi:hypothetical protein HZA98_04285 [Candidatus Woesearchaeota archaeon]|nr:hypothetical protein [Candidatus Woesearchaeota archaeon]